MKRFERELITLREYLVEVEELFREVANKIYHLESDIRLASRDDYLLTFREDSPPQKKVRFVDWTG